MAFPSNSLAEITLVQQRNSNQILNVFQYEVGTVPGTVDAEHIAEAWWNAVKVAWRAIMGTQFGAYFMAVRVRELNNSAGAFADWNVPVGEQVGTRAPTANPQGLPMFNALAMRLLVGTRLTRPGQKRLYGLTETDNDDGAVAAAYVVLVNSLGIIFSSQFVLGAPAATVTLDPIVASKDANGTVINQQPVIGFLINPNVSSQNTRKPGRGI